MAENKITIGYWNIPGRVQPSRDLLEIAGVEYNDVRYSNPDDWFNRDKYNLGLDFPNLPYLIDGNVKLTESEAIMDYLIYKLNKTELLGKESDKFTVSMLRHVFQDIGTRYYQFSQLTKEERPKFLNEQLLPKFNDLKKFVGSKEYLLGYFTIADVYFYGIISSFKRLAPEAYTEFAETFDPFFARIAAIP